jgi:hypothetical protein
MKRILFILILGLFSCEKDNLNNYNEYQPICSRIKEQIRQDQIEGGMVGQYNPSITQRLNNLTDKQEHKVNITKFDFDE